MIRLLFVIVLLTGFGFKSQAQVYGELHSSKRRIVQNIPYTITGQTPGVIVYDVVVDEKGKVSSCSVDLERTTVRSTPMKVKGRNLITGQLQFVAGTEYPKFHRGQVKITVVKPE